MRISDWSSDVCSSDLAGARRLGARLVEVPPGKKAWPYHCHHANDEMFVILSGRGELRFGGEVYPCAAGDVVVCPSGGPETAPQLRSEERRVGTECVRTCRSRWRR